MVELIVAVLLAASPLQAAGQEGKVSGTLTLNGATVSLTHVYASAQPGFFNKASEDIRVLLSDVPLDEASRADVFALIKLGRDDKAHILEVVIGASGIPVSGSFFAREFDGMVSATGMHIFSRDQMDERTIAGRLFVDRPREFHGVIFAYDVAFTAPIPRPRTEAERATAVAGEAGRAAEAHLAAIRAGAPAALLATVTADYATDFAGASGAELLAQLRADMPADSHVVDVVPQVDGSMAAIVEGHDGGIVIGYTWRLVLEGGGWRVRR